MNKKKLIELPIEISFILVWIVLYILFMLEDFADYELGENIWIKYSIVLTAFVYVLISTGFANSPKGIKDNILLSLALLFTLISDYFLLVLDDYYTIGLTTFIVAQILHALRIERNKIHTIVAIVIRVILPVIGIIVLASVGELNLLYALVCIYGVQLLLNFVENMALCFISKTNKLKYILLSIGFALFIACDVCVGLFNIGEYGGMLLMWVFYAPSQVLIALSANK